MSAILILTAVAVFLLLLWNLLHWYMEKKFRRSFGFSPPQGREKYAIRAFQPRVDQRLRELAATLAEDKEAMKRLVDRMSEFPISAFTPFGIFTEKGKELKRVRAEYDRLTNFDLARGTASFFNFRVGEREDYL